MMDYFDNSLFHAATGVVFFMLLLISAVSDVKTRRILKICSYGLLLISLLRLVYDRQYVLAAYFALSVFATGSKSLKLFVHIGAAVIFVNEGESSFPLVFGLAAADLLFTLKIIGGGDAQLLFSMIGFGYKSWKMAASVSAITIIAGFMIILYSSRSINLRERITSIKDSWKTGMITSDHNRLKIPFATLLPIAFLLYSFVLFSK
ncbi:MAG: hypothetical protein II969_17735 [Anaerolineaceae bacterium]|nr:hypothetical protein [Anaerolineaceae bacterium]